METYVCLCVGGDLKIKILWSVTYVDPKIYIYHSLYETSVLLCSNEHNGCKSYSENINNYSPAKIGSIFHGNLQFGFIIL